MARKKGTALKETQQGLQAAVQTRVDSMKEAIANLVEDELFDFILGGGLDQEIVKRMTPVYQEFEDQAAASVSAASSSSRLSLPSSDGVVNVGATDV